MGAGAVSGHSTPVATPAQNGVHPPTGLSSGTQLNNSHHSGGESETASPTTTNPTQQSPPPPIDRSKVKSSSQMKMSCEMCSVNFTLFKRKKCCQECHRYFCSNCLPKPPSNSPVGRQCSKCRLIMSGHFSRDDLQNWKVKDMRCFLNVRNISTKDCREKHDLIEVLLAKFCTKPQLTAQEQIEHEKLVRQMAAHMRDVSFVDETFNESSPGSSCNNSPASTRNSTNAAEPSPTIPPPPASSSSPSSSSASASSSTTTTAQAGPAFGPQPQPASSSSSSSENGARSRDKNGTEKSGPGSCGGQQQQQQGAERLRDEETERDTPGFDVNHERLRELLESMERIQEVLAQREEREQEETKEAPIRRAQLNDITELSQIDDLSIRQLKELLVNNFVDYRGCCEKPELVDKTKRLWKDYQENKLRAERLHQEDEESAYQTQETAEKTAPSEQKNQEDGDATLEAAGAQNETEASAESATSVNSISEDAATTTAEATPTVPTATSSAGGPPRQRDDTLCHVCMDSLVDCILLECGHMVTCTQCGKRLADCPICRQYISRVVRVFRS